MDPDRLLLRFILFASMKKIYSEVHLNIYEADVKSHLESSAFPENG